MDEDREVEPVEFRIITETIRFSENKREYVEAKTSSAYESRIVNDIKLLKVRKRINHE
jgi:hypothetical protein